MSARILSLLTCAALLAACGGRSRALPDVAGPLAGAIIDASLAGEPEPGGPLLVDSSAFVQLGVLLTGTPYTAADLRAQVSRPAELADAVDVLLCPRREPCRVRDDRTWITVWDALRTGDELELVVSRVFNVERLHVMTSSVTHRLRFTRDAAGWRLVSRELLPA